MGVVIRRYINIFIIIINFPYSTCIRSFFGSSYIILAISISPDASHRMYYFLLTIIITSVIQRINGASLKETLGSTAK